METVAGGEDWGGKTKRAFGRKKPCVLPALNWICFSSGLGFSSQMTRPLYESNVFVYDSGVGPFLIGPLIKRRLQPVFTLGFRVLAPPTYILSPMPPYYHYITPCIFCSNSNIPLGILIY
ncbi:hypothetical protein ACJQWK_09673 [Exserohilum turcicum]